MPLLPRLTLLLLCTSLGSCFLFEPIVTFPGELVLHNSHARAEAALARGDLDAAEGFITGTRYRHRSNQIPGPSLAELHAQAAQILLAAHARGQAVEPEALYRAHMVAAEGHDPGAALEQLEQAQQLLDSGVLTQPEDKRQEIFWQRFPTLLLYRYLESGGLIDWQSNIGMGLSYLRFPAREPLPGEPDPRDFYRFPGYLTPADREWLFARLPLRQPLDEAIWRDEARLQAFIRSTDYYGWYEANGFDWLLSTHLNALQGPEQTCIARRRGYRVQVPAQWDLDNAVDPQTCRRRPPAPLNRRG